MDQTDTMSSSSRRLQDPLSYHEQVDIGRRGDDDSYGKANEGGSLEHPLSGNSRLCRNADQALRSYKHHDGQQFREGVGQDSNTKSVHLGSPFIYLEVACCGFSDCHELRQ